MATEISRINAPPPAAPSVPREIAWVLRDSEYDPGPWRTADKLARLRADGLTENLADYARQSRAALRPVDRDWLFDRLSLLWDSMSLSADADKATAWLHETHRLLCDIPQDILATAIDEAIKKSARGFMPSVGEIRVIADPMFGERQKSTARLEALVRLDQEGGRQEKSEEPFEPCTPQQAQAAREEFGIKYGDEPRRPKYDKPPRNPTREDYIALGVDPITLA